MKNAISSVVALITLAITSSSFAFSISIDDPTYSTSFYDSPSVNNDYSLYMIGVYETRSDHSGGYHPTGTANVEIGDQFGKDTILVLSSYESTKWNITGLGIDDITSVILYGYHDQSIFGLLASTLVTEYSYDDGQNYQGMTYEFAGDGQVVNHLAAQDLVVSSFAGSYRATSFRIAELSSVSVPEPTSLGLFLMGLMVFFSRKLKSHSGRRWIF
jgi:hypothetical protein